MGKPSADGHNGTICGLKLDGEYVSLATYHEYSRGVLVVPHDYSPSWVYVTPEEEQQRLADEIMEIARNLGAS